MSVLSSRDRMLRAISGREPDYAPCSFMIFGALEQRCQGHFEFVAKQMALGLDPFVQVPPRAPKTQSDHGDLFGPPVRFDPRVSVREWREDRKDERYPVLCKEYETPEGTLRVEVAKSEDWPYGDHVPFLDDFLIPRSLKFIVEKIEDLDALKYLLIPSPKEDVEAFRANAAEAKRFAEERGLLLAAGWGVAADMAGWLCGLSNLIYMAADQPDLLHAAMDAITRYNRQRMELMLDAGVDLFIRRGWYEGADFWSPALYRRYLLPGLKKEVALAHSRGAKFGYINTTGTMPLLDLFLEAGIDVLIGVDPVQGSDTDMAAMKRKLAGKMALWGGVNGFVTVERGTKEEVEQAVAEAMRILAPGGGFILSPVDNIRDTSDRTWRNVVALIDAWRRLR